MAGFEVSTGGPGVADCELKTRFILEKQMRPRGDRDKSCEPARMIAGPLQQSLKEARLAGCGFEHTEDRRESEEKMGLRGSQWASGGASGQRGQKRGDDLELQVLLVPIAIRASL